MSTATGTHMTTAKNWILAHAQWLVVGVIALLLLGVAGATIIQQGGLTPKVDTTVGPVELSEAPLPAPHAGGPDYSQIRSYLVEVDRSFGAGSVCSDVTEFGLSKAGGVFRQGYLISRGHMPDENLMLEVLKQFCS